MTLINTWDGVFSDFLKCIESVKSQIGLYLLRSAWSHDAFIKCKLSQRTWYLFDFSIRTEQKRRASPEETKRSTGRESGRLWCGLWFQRGKRLSYHLISRHIFRFPFYSLSKLISPFSPQQNVTLDAILQVRF